MTTEFIKPDDAEDFEKTLRAQNKYELEVRTVTLVGGPLDSTTFELPNGVPSVTAETADDVYVYFRSSEDPLVFKMSEQFSRTLKDLSDKVE